MDRCVPYARSKRTLQPVFAESCDPHDKHECIGCGCDVSFVREHTRKRRRDIAEETIVSAHFRHHSGSACSNESISHKLAKEILCQLDVPIQFTPPCGHTLEWVWNTGTIRKDEVTTATGRRADVGVLDRATGKIVAAIEVLHTHAVCNEKEADFRAEDLPWVEVCVADVITWFDTRQGAVQAIMLCLYRECTNCELEKFRRARDTCIQQEKTRIYTEIDSWQQSTLDIDSIREYIFLKVKSCEENHLIAVKALLDEVAAELKDLTDDKLDVPLKLRRTWRLFEERVQAFARQLIDWTRVVESAENTLQLKTDAVILDNSAGC